MFQTFRADLPNRADGLSEQSGRPELMLLRIRDDSGCEPAYFDSSLGLMCNAGMRTLNLWLQKGHSAAERKPRRRCGGFLIMADESACVAVPTLRHSLNGVRRLAPSSDGHFRESACFRIPADEERLRSLSHCWAPFSIINKEEAAWFLDCS